MHALFEVVQYASQRAMRVNMRATRLLRANCFKMGAILNTVYQRYFEMCAYAHGSLVCLLLRLHCSGDIHFQLINLTLTLTLIIRHHTFSVVLFHVRTESWSYVPFKVEIRSSNRLSKGRYISLTPSPWTNQMDYPKNTILNEYC